MQLTGVKIGFGLTASFCTLEPVLQQIERFTREGAEIYPIMTREVATVDTRFGKAREWMDRLTRITGKQVMMSIVDVEPIGPQKLVDVVVIAPCTGNTLAKLANGITDGAVLMAAKAQLRNQRPVVIAISTNDGLGLNARNLGSLLNTRNVYFVPFGQDSPRNKPNSLIAKMDLLGATIVEALQGRQLQPLIVTYS
jgi:dipicolinate synthase subunit B